MDTGDSRLALYKLRLVMSYFPSTPNVTGLRDTPRSIVAVQYQRMPRILRRDYQDDFARW
jgi:hypothetical protein